MKGHLIPTQDWINRKIRFCDMCKTAEMLNIIPFIYWLWLESGLQVLWDQKQRIANRSWTYLRVSAPCDILNKSWFTGESDKDRGEDESSHSAIIFSDAGSWIIWQQDNTHSALDSRPSAPADFHPQHTHTHTHRFVALPLLTPCCLCIVNVGQ